jgi:hypothetical protein
MSMEAGSGREASVTVAKAVDGDVCRYSVQRRAVLARMTVDGCKVLDG